MKKSLFAATVLFLLFCLTAHSQIVTDPDKKTDWWGDIDGYINQQDKVTLKLVNDALLIHPPSLNDDEIRKLAFMMIDNVLHEEKAAFRPAVQDFFKARFRNAVSEIINEKVDKGAVVWKLYNHAFVVKTKSVTIGFDIQRGVTGVEDFRIPEELISELAEVVDILFISHYHNDHADEWVAGEFLKRNKPVVTAPEIFSKADIYNKIIHPERAVGKLQEITLPSTGKKLELVVYPGHQGEKILNNVYLVFTSENLSFLHTGDQSNSNDLEWIDRISESFPVDVAMINSWSYYPGQRLANGIKPKLIIPGHENELGHTIDHREPYWLNYTRLGEGVIYPWIQMTWGEKYHYFTPTYSTLNAHSHNDYENTIPFRLAYDNRFGSIEADIWAVNGDLFVSHNKQDIKPERTLDALYLEPIVKLFRANGGQAWNNSKSTFELLIDLKTDVEPTLSMLVEKLKLYPDVFDPVVNKNAVRIVITGNRPEPSGFSKYPDFIYFDGVLNLKYDDSQLKRVALFSENLRNIIKWNGEGEIGKDEKIRLQAVIDSVHALDKKIRFWNAPDNINSWNTFMKMKIDYINTDHIVKLAEFLTLSTGDHLKRK